MIRDFMPSLSSSTSARHVRNVFFIFLLYFSEKQRKKNIKIARKKKAKSHQQTEKENPYYVNVIIKKEKYFVRWRWEEEDPGAVSFAAKRKSSYEILMLTSFLRQRRRRTWADVPPCN